MRTDSNAGGGRGLLKSVPGTTLKNQYGKPYLPAEPNRYTSGKRRAKEAHEAVPADRPWRTRPRARREK